MPGVVYGKHGGMVNGSALVALRAGTPIYYWVGTSYPVADLQYARYEYRLGQTETMIVSNDVWLTLRARVFRGYPKVFVAMNAERRLRHITEVVLAFTDA